MLLAKLAGATVFTSDPMPERRAKSVSLGAAASFDPRADDLASVVRARTGNRGADAVLVATPIPAVVAEALALARPGGRALLFAQNDPKMRIEFPAAAVGVDEKERSEEHTSELQSLRHLVCRLLLEKKKYKSDTEHGSQEQQPDA